MTTRNKMQKHYYLIAALVFFALAGFSAFLVRNSQIGSTQKFVMEKIVSNALLLTAGVLLFTWGVRLLR